MSARSVALAAVLLVASAARAEDARGDWIGSLNSGFQVRVHIERSPAGYVGQIVNPSGQTTALDAVAADGARLRFAITKLDLSYEGTWNATRGAWEGRLVFRQTYPLALRRAMPGEMAPPVRRRPQEDAIRSEPKPYRDVEVRFENTVDHDRLAGTLTLPEGAGPFPAVVLISGTGRNTRDEDVQGHKVFLVLADSLARSGLAVLRYDKRGAGESTGDYGSATTADFASDAAAAVAWLRSRAEIDPQRIGLLGHSEGGVIAPMVAARDRSVAFVILIAAPALRGDKLFVLQAARTAKAYGAPPDYIAKRAAFDRRLYDAIISASGPDEALVRAKALVALGVRDKLIDANEADSFPADDASAWERFFLAHDPAATLAKVRAPVLALNGDLDVQVPARENLAALRRALAGNPDVTVFELPGLNHLLQSARTGAPDEYDGIEETIAPRALSIIVDWVGRKTRTSGRPAGEGR